MKYGSGKYTYEVVDEWAKIPKGLELGDVLGIAIDHEDTIYLFNRSDHPIMVFDRDGDFITSWGGDYFKRIHGIHIGPDESIYCTDVDNHIVTKFDLDGNILMVLGIKNQSSDTGYAPGPNFYESLMSITRGGPPFNRPTGIAVASNGNIYVSDGYGNARVHVFSPEGKLLFSWGEPGLAPGQFMLPHAIWVDHLDRVWVADRENNRIQIFSINGEFLSQWTGLLRPATLYIKDEIVYIAELGGRISIFSFKGDVLTRWENEGHVLNDPLLIAPHGIAVDSQDALYVGEAAMNFAKIDPGSRIIQKFIRK